MLLLILILVVAAYLSACGNKDKKAGQTLVRVNGDDITILLLNNELQRAGIQADQLEDGRKQLLESLIDRQLIVTEARRNRIDRTPEVMQSIEHAKTQVIVQAYLQNIASKMPKPSRTEIHDYYQTHPAYFAKRKDFDLNQLIIPNEHFSPELKSFIASSKSLDDTAAWMDSHDVQYERAHIIRSTADLPQVAVTKLLQLPKGKMFLASDGENKILSAIAVIKERPVSPINAELQIERYLSSQKYKDAVNSEMAHLRSLAKIEYLNAPAPPTSASAAKLPHNNSDKTR